MDKKVKWGIITLIGARLIGWDIYSQLPKASEELTAADKAVAGKQINKRVLNVNAKIIKSQLLTGQTRISGSLMSDEKVDLSFGTSGKIAETNFDEGSAVKEGQLLVKVNDCQLQVQLQRLIAQLKLAEGHAFHQNTPLERDAVSKEAYEQVKTELTTLNADIDLVKASTAMTKLHAPFDGVIGLRQISIGSYASPTTIVARLTKIIPLKVGFSVPERYASQVKKGINLSFESEGKSGSFPAKTYATESRINQSARTLTVHALYANGNGTLLPGRYASTQLEKEKILNAIAIPSEAIVLEIGKGKVFLYKSDKAEPVEVAAGIRTGAEVQIIKGLQTGDIIITSGILQLRIGLPVTLDNIN